MDIDHTLKSAIAGLLDNGHRDSEIKASKRLREDLGLDSIALVDLMVEVESRFGVYFDPLENDLAQVFSTVGSLGEFVAAKSPGG